MKQCGWSTIFLASVLILFASACEPGSENGRAHLEVWLTDSPGDFEEVNVDILGVEIHASQEAGDDPWMTLTGPQGVINLLELTNGIDTLIARDDIPAGKISQIRLLLGENNTVKVGGNFYTLSVPSGATSGLKLQVHETLREGITYKMLLDFDAARSVVKTANGEYILKPVIRSVTEAQSGAIQGSVDPAESTPAIYAISGTDTVATTFANNEGAFLLRGVHAGTYVVTFEPNENYLSFELDNVVVETGEVTHVGSVSLMETTPN